MANYSIKDLENFTGIKAHTIRIWEKRYNLVEPKRTCTNIRYYDDDDLKKLLNVSILNRHGFKISNIANFSDSMINEKIYDLSQSANDDISQVESLVVAMIDLDESKFDKVFNTTVINYGFEETVLKLIYPFFEKVGILWQIGSINPAQEHFISNLIRQKMIMAIEGLMPSISNQSKSFLLFLPEGEHHELGLIFYHYLTKKYNHKVIYLGESVPLDALTEVFKNHKFDYILTSFTTPLPEENFEESVRKLLNNLNDTVLLLSGMQATKLDKKEFSSVQYLKNAMDLKAFLQKL
jgi:DNA-binding transcriptional MerR regulator